MPTTLDDLTQAGTLMALRVDLGPRAQPLRRVLVTQAFEDWMNELSDRRSGPYMLSERVELAGALADFIGRVKLGGLIVDQRQPAGQGIRKIKTPQLRLYGWAAATQTLVLAAGDRKDRIKSSRGSERNLANTALNVRRSLGLTDFVRGSWYDVFRVEG